MKNNFIRIRTFFSKYAWFERIVVILKKRRGDFIDQEYINLLSSANSVIISDKIKGELKVGLVKDINTYKGHIQKRSHWVKYERFLKANKINYSFININKSTWMEEVKGCQLVIYRPDISPSAMHDAESKIYFIENYLKIKCFPSYNELWLYEDKIRANYLYNYLNIPHVSTFISNDKNEVLGFVNKTDFPIVSKISCGSASRGVVLLKNKTQAIRLTKRVFSEGAKTYWTEYRQKNYVYLQEFIKDSLFDLRIIIVGNKAFGYYRMKPENDFRASGAGIYKKTELPLEALKIAVGVKDSLNTTVLAVDFIKRESTDEYLVIETSIFFDVDTPEQLVVNDVPGYYEIIRDNLDIKFEFKPAKLWIQELIINEIIEKNKLF